MKNKVLTIMFSVIITLLLLTIKLQAVTYTSTDCTVKSEESITITVKASENMQNYDMSLTSYTGLTFTGCSANENAAVNSSTGAISFATLGSGVTTLGTYTFKAPKVTKDTTYNVVFNINGVSNTAKVTVKAKEIPPPASNSGTSGSSSSNNSSSSDTTSSSSSNSSGASSSNNSPEPKSKLTAVTVDGTTYNNGDRIVVENDKSTVTICGVGTDLYHIKINDENSGINVKLNEGTNSIVVYDNNGEKIKISIIRKAKEEETKPNVIEKEEEEKNEEEKEELVLNTLEVEGLELNQKFSPNTFSYTININADKNDYSSIKVKASSNQEDATIKIDGAEEIVEGENVVNIIVTSKDGSEIKTYQIIVNKIVSKTEIVETSAEAEPIKQEENENKDNKKLLIIVGCAGALIVIALTIGIVKKKNSEEDDEFGALYNYDLYVDKNSEIKEKNTEKADNKETEIENTAVEEKQKKEKKKKRSKGKHA